jgi:hypothetical protein
MYILGIKSAEISDFPNFGVVFSLLDLKYQTMLFSYYINQELLKSQENDTKLISYLSIILINFL